MTLLDDPDEPRGEGPRTVAAVVLAAGSGQRFGAATKQLALLDGWPLVAHVVTTAIDARVDRVVVVVGHAADEVAEAATRAHAGVEVVVNPDHAAGQAGSLVAGIRAVAAHDDAVAVVLLADQPRVRAATVRAVVAAVRDGATAARARYADGPGHPVAFSRAVFTRLTGEVTGDAGARHLLAELGVVAVPAEGTIPVDVDEPADLDLLR